MNKRRGWGKVRELPSGRLQASYIGPDLARHVAPYTFDTDLDAGAWLVAEHRLISAGQWTSPKSRAATQATPTATVGERAEAWLARRQRGPRPLAPRTVAHYRRILDRFILPTFGTQPLTAVTLHDVADWHDALLEVTGPRYQAHAYSVLRSVFADAVRREAIDRSPCRVEGAGLGGSMRTLEPASLDELRALTAAMPERLRLMVDLMGWCALRYGEAAELRRSDVDTAAGVLHVRRAVVQVDGRSIVSDPKARSGRDVAIPPHLLPAAKAHLAAHAAWGRAGLLFPARNGGHLGYSTFRHHFDAARIAAGRPDLRPHDLRHTGLTLAAQTGATIAELQARAGHKTASMAMRYQHAARNRDTQIAAALSAMAEGTTGH